MEEQWSGTAEAARDLHRTLLTSQTQITTSRTLDTENMASVCRLYPEVGTASELAQPGGFRRAYLRESLSESAPQDSYGSRTLVAHLTDLSRCTTPGLTSHVIQELSDGMALRFRSRAYRLGAPPEVVRPSPSYAELPADDGER